MAGKTLPELVFDEINACRKDPKKYSEKLTQTLKYYNGNMFEKPGCLPIETEEGPENVKDCILFLKF